MITTVGTIILNNLSQEIRDSKFFSIMSDEVADISNIENLSVMIRFLHSNKTVREEFMEFWLCEDGASGAAIRDLIIGAVGDWGLSMDDCRGQCYDGAGNMSGRLNGASSLIRAEHDKAIYVHCMNHMLNLCVADTCQLPLVRNMMDVVRKLSEFFDNSPKWQQQFDQQDYSTDACCQPLCSSKCVSNKVDWEHWWYASNCGASSPSCGYTWRHFNEQKYS